MSIRPVQGTTDVIRASDNNNVVAYFSSSPVAATVPAGLPFTFRTTIAQIGAGVVTLSAGTGVTLGSEGGSLATAGQYGEIAVTGFSTNEFIVAPTGGGGGGGGGSITLTAGTNLAAGTAIAVNSSGDAVQTWGVAPNFAGQVTVFNAPTGGGQQPAPVVLRLSASLFIVFQSGGPPFVGTKSVSVSGATVTAGTNNTLNMENVTSAAALDATTFVFTYIDGSSANQLAVGSVSGGVVTFGTPVALSGANNFSISALTTTSFVVTYLVGGQGTFAVGTVSGTTITLGTPGNGTLPATLTSPIQVLTLSVASVLLVYTDPGTSNNLFAAVGTVSGTTLTEFAPAQLSTAVVANVTFTSVGMDSAHVCMAWNEITGVNSYQGFAVVASISGTTVTFGTTARISVATNNTPWVITLSATELAFWTNYTQPSFASVSGTTLTVTLGASLNLPWIGSGQGVTTPLTANLLFPPIVPLSSTQYIWEDAFWNIYEADISGDVSPPLAHRSVSSFGLLPIDATRVLAVLTDFQYNVIARVLTFGAINASGPIGFTASSVSSSGSATIVTSGICGGFSGLAAGVQYFISGDGTVTTNNTGYPAGKAVSSTQINVQTGGGVPL